MNPRIKNFGLVILFILPSLVFAADLKSMITDFGGLVTKAIPIVFGLALLFFFWGMAKFIYSAGDMTGKAEGKSIMIWGVIGLFVMFSVLALIQFVQQNLGIQPINISNSSSVIKF